MFESGAVAFTLLVSESDADDAIDGVDAGVDARVEVDEIDDEGLTDDEECVDEALQSPKPERQPSPQKSGPSPQYSN